MKEKILIITLLSIFFVNIIPVNSQEYNPLVLRNVKIMVTLDKEGNAHVSIRGKMVNSAKVPVVPGYGYVNLTIEPSRVSNLRAKVSGKEVEAVKLKDRIRYTIWQPISPGKGIEVEISFTVGQAVSKGILFHEFRMPISRFSTRVEGATVSVKVPPGTYVTYVKPRPVSISTTVTWRLGNSTEYLELEYSPIPMPVMPVKAYLVFWPILAFLFILLGLIIRKIR